MAKAPWRADQGYERVTALVDVGRSKLFEPALLVQEHPRLSAPDLRSGGRQAYLAACSLRGVDAAIDCYGGGVVAKPEELTPRQPVAPIELTKDLQCPLLGLFGVEDARPSPEDVAKTEEALKKFGKTYEFHTYDNAGHAFFAVDRPQYRVHAAVDGWKKVFAWFEKHLQ